MTEVSMAGGPVVGDDGLARCPWAGGDPLNRDYHDKEWGMPVHGEHALLERITLEAFQSGLSWLTILRKRPAFRTAFAGFDAEVVAAFTGDDVARLMADAGIVRNRAKILATLQNARAAIDTRARGGLDALIWAHRKESPDAPRSVTDLRAETPASQALARDLRSNGFVFVGPTTAWALMQAIGLVDDHLVGCHRRGAAGRHTRPIMCRASRP
jgi:DNA-3-methyladenine glycosylase I